MTDLHDRTTPGRDGARAMLPLLVGVAPLGLVVGVEAAAADIPSAAGFATGLTIYGASAQLAALDLLDQGAGWLVVVLVVVVINLRLALYSVAMAEPWRDLGPGRRALAAYLLVDPSYAVGTEDRRFRWYLGGAATLWVGWQLLVGVGMAFGSSVPTGLHLEMAVPLCLMAIVAGQAKDRAAGQAAAVAAVVAVAAHGLPLGTGLPLAILAGIMVGARR